MGTSIGQESQVMMMALPQVHYYLMEHYQKIGFIIKIALTMINSGVVHFPRLVNRQIKIILVVGMKTIIDP